MCVNHIYHHHNHHHNNCHHQQLQNSIIITSKMKTPPPSQRPHNHHHHHHHNHHHHHHHHCDHQVRAYTTRVRLGTEASLVWKSCPMTSPATSSQGEQRGLCYATSLWGQRMSNEHNGQKEWKSVQQILKEGTDMFCSEYRYISDCHLQCEPFKVSLKTWI